MSIEIISEKTAKLNVILDYDGTLHECNVVYAPAFRKAYQELVKSGLAPERTVTDKEVSYWLGFPAKEMWESFAPNLSDEQRLAYTAIINKEMLRLIEAGQARLYPGVEDMLNELLAQGYRLIFLSNCDHKYLEHHRRHFGLDRYFAAMYCAEDCDWLPKTEVFKQIFARFGGSPADYVVVGDRSHDIDIAVTHGLKSIGCTYGYGSPEELTAATALANSPSEIPGLITKLCGKR
jgi:phosphoglycolate phosphatase